MALYPITLIYVLLTSLLKVDLHSGKDKDANTVNVVEGEGPYNSATTVTTVTTKPGVAGTFPIAVTNQGSTADNYNLVLSRHYHLVDCRILCC